MIFDALGNPIVIGERYGYSQRANGIVTVVIGTASKINEEKGSVTLDIERKLYGVGKNPLKTDNFQVRNTSTVASNSIFPLREEPINWVEEDA